MADMRISELTTAAGLHDGDLFETSQTDSISSSGYASYKTSLNAIAAFIAKQVQFSGDLQTTSKTLIGAINEVFNAGTSVTVTNVLPATETTKRVATITVDGVAKDINADDTVKVITDLKTPKSATITNGIAQFECIEENLVKGLKVTMNPIQDLNGYDHPWAGGAGKNKLIYPYKSGTKTDHDVTFTVNSDGTVNLSGTSSGYAEFVFQSRLDGTLTLPAGSYILSGGINYDIYLSVADSSGTNLGYDRGSGLTFTLDAEQAISVWIGIAGSVNTNGKKIEPMLRLSTETDATFAPYSNICPISGRTEVSVTRTGANQWDEEWESGGYNASGEKVIWSGAIRSKNTIIVKPNTSFYLHFPSSALYVCWYTDTTFIERVAVYSNGVITAPSTATRMAFCTGNSYGDTYNNDISINYPSTDTSYHAYTAETHTHQYSETIYGGTDDFVNGGATSEWGIAQIKDFTWSYTGQYFATRVNEKKIGITNVICEIYQTSTAASTSGMGDKSIKGREQDGNVYIKDSSITDAETLVSTYGDYYFCYELATPTTISTSAEEITTVEGTNIISGTEPISECKYTELATVDDLIKIIGGQ